MYIIGLDDDCWLSCNNLEEKFLFYFILFYFILFYLLQISLEQGCTYSLPLSEEFGEGELISVVFTIAVCS